MLPVPLSQRERFCIFVVFAAQGSWGGDEASLLARADIFDALNLDDVSQIPAQTETGKLSDGAALFELSREQVGYLASALVVGGQSWAMGRTLAKVVRRLRALLAAPPGTEESPR